MTTEQTYVSVLEVPTVKANGKAMRGVPKPVTPQPLRSVAGSPTSDAAKANARKALVALGYNILAVSVTVDGIMLVYVSEGTQPKRPMRSATPRRRSR